MSLLNGGEVTVLLMAFKLLFQLLFELSNTHGNQVMFIL